MRNDTYDLVAAVALLSAFNGRFLVFNDAPNRVEDLSNELLELNEQMRTIQAKADAEKRELTGDEAKEIESILARFGTVEDEIDRRKRIEAAGARLAEPNGRRTDPDDIVNRGGEPGQRRVPAAPRSAEDAGKWGFKSFGEFAKLVRQAAMPGGERDARLTAITNAPTTYGQEGVGADGGFAVPPDFRATIIKKIMGEDSMLGRTDQQTSSSNSVTFPTDETNPGASGGGIQAYWEGEGDQKGQSKPNLKQTTARLNKLAAIVPVTDEMLDDQAQMSNYLRSKTPEVFDARVNDAIIAGTGVGMPLGILNSGGLITVAKESGQDGGTVLFQNIVNMWARLRARSRAGAVWIINQDIEPQLMSMQFPGTGTAVPAYMPAGGLSDSPYARLLGRPVIATESAEALGSPGDIILGDLSQYLTVSKVGGIRQDVSIHLWFDFDITAFRFVLRLAGQPWWNSPVTPRNSQLTRGDFVALAERA